MKDKELIKEMYYFAMELARKLDSKDFDSFRIKWNDLMNECERKLQI